MGAQLVTLVLTRWAPHISDRAFRVLVRMAHTALDSESGNGRPPKMYFAGRELLAETLRNERGGKRETRYWVVRQAVNELVKVGAIERVGPAYTGIRQAYRLTLDAEPTGVVQHPPTGVVQRPPSSGERGSPAQQEGWSSIPPKEPLGVMGSVGAIKEVPTSSGSRRAPETLKPWAELQRRYDDDPDSFDVVEELGLRIGDLDPGEQRTAEGMIGNGAHVKTIANTILADRHDDDDSPDQTDFAGLYKARACPECGVWLDPGDVCGNRRCYHFGLKVAP